MDTEIVLKVGDRVSFHEDGGICVCDLLEYLKDERQERAKLKIVEILQQPRLGSDYEIGDEFSVFHRLDCGGWGGDWFIERNLSRVYRPVADGRGRNREESDDERRVDGGRQ